MKIKEKIPKEKNIRHILKTKLKGGKA